MPRRVGGGLGGGWVRPKAQRKHLVEDINFRGVGKVTCICGWEGVVYDAETGEESLDFAKHRGSRDRGRAERAAERAD